MADAETRATMPAMGRAQIWQRQREIAQALTGWQPDPHALVWWRHYRQWGRYPFGSGQYAEQPAWVVDEIANYGLWLEFETLDRWKAKLIT